MTRRALPALLALVLLAGAASPSWATEEFAERTGRDCAECHLGQGGTGQPPPGAFRALRSAVRFVHLAFAFLWLGTILYVHLVLKPAYAHGGLPRQEVRLAWVAMPAVAVSGTLLGWWMVRADPHLLSTRFGHLLVAKTAVFLLMVASAAFVTRFLGPRLAARARSTPTALAAFDGREGRRALVAAAGVVYEVTGSRLWKGGSHAGRHQAGQDLTAALEGAPHGAEVLERVPRVGPFSPEGPRASGIVRLFDGLAYANLGAGLLILLLVALWRW